MCCLSYGDASFLLQNQCGLFPTSPNDAISLNSASSATTTREEESRELLHWRQQTRRGGGKGWTACTATGTNIRAGNTDKSLGKQKDKKMKDAGLFLSKTSLLPWTCTASLEAAGMQTWDESYHQVNHLAVGTLVCMDTRRVNTHDLLSWHLRKRVEEHPSGRQAALWS